MSPVTAPQAPGRLGAPAQPQAMLKYLGELDAWLAGRRSELAALDSEVIARQQQALTPDIALSLALWQAVKNRYELLLVTWDSGRVGPTESDRLASLTWGRLDTGSSTSTQLSGMAVTLPEACRLSDALVAQLRQRLSLDPNIEQQANRLRDLAAQLERIRDQIQQEPPVSRSAATAQLSQLAGRLEELRDKRERGGDIGGLLGPLEIDAARFERDLIVGSAQRRENRDVLARARELTEDVRNREQALRQLVAKAEASVAPTPRQEVPEVQSLGPIPNTRAAIDGYLARLGTLSRQLQVVQDGYGQALLELDQLTGLIDALHAKGQALGHGDDPDLGTLLELSRRVIAHRPAPMPVVRQLTMTIQAQLDWLTQGRGGAR